MANKKQSQDKPTPENSQVTRRTALTAAAAGVAGWLTVSAAPSSAQGLMQRQATANIVRWRRQSPSSALKQIAQSDYQSSLAGFGGRLSSPIHQLAYQSKPGVPYDMDIAIVGSGYGGSICAARLAQQMQPGTRICVLERGKEWVPGNFPDTFRGVISELRLGFRRQNQGVLMRPTGLFSFHKGDDVDVIVGSGLGGTSLLNANVAIKPDPVVFRRKGWPQALRYREVLDPFFDAVALELAINPTGLTSSPKMIAQRRAASRLAVPDRQFYAANLAVTLDGRFLDPATGRNRQGMIQRPCTFCGDCMSGCNTGAKNTLQMNYLPLAKAHGAEIYTQVEARRVEKLDGYYRLHLVYHYGDGKDVQSIPFTRTARIVVLAGGSLGSTGIMMRSRDYGLPVSRTLGYRWSGNGDTLGFVTNTDALANSAGVGAYPYSTPPVGPSIQSVTRMYGHAHPGGRILIQDGNMPRAYANVLGLLMRDRNLDNTMVMFGMGHDGSAGRIVMKNDVAVVDWPNAKTTEYRARMRKHFELMADAHGGRYRFLRAFGSNLITVHPLGGCNMADDPRYGVVNDRGQVLDGRYGGYAVAGGHAAVHDGLYVADGSVIPGSLGANPFFTIGAISERIAASIAMHPSYQDIFTYRA